MTPSTILFIYSFCSGLYSQPKPLEACTARIKQCYKTTLSGTHNGGAETWEPKARCLSKEAKQFKGLK